MDGLILFILDSISMIAADYSMCKECVEGIVEISLWTMVLFACTVKDLLCTYTSNKK